MILRLRTHNNIQLSFECRLYPVEEDPRFCSLLFGLAVNYRHSLIAWNFIEDNWKKINEIFPNNTIPRMFGGIKSISDEGLAKRVSSFFEKNPIPQGQKTIDQNIEKMKINLKFVDNQSKILNNWLNNN